MAFKFWWFLYKWLKWATSGGRITKITPERSEDESYFLINLASVVRPLIIILTSFWGQQKTKPRNGQAGQWDDHKETDLSESTLIYVTHIRTSVQCKLKGARPDLAATYRRALLCFEINNLSCPQRQPHSTLMHFCASGQGKLLKKRRTNCKQGAHKLIES